MKRPVPWMWITGGGAAAFIAILAALFLGGRDDTDLVLHQAETALAGARKASAEGRWEEADRGYARALAAIEGRDGTESRRRAWKAERAELQSRRAARAALDRRWAALEAAGAAADLRDLQVLRADAEGWPVAWRSRLDALLERRRAAIPARPPSFELKRAELSGALAGRWSELKAAWTEYAARPDTDGDDRRKTAEELKRIEIRAREDLRLLLLRAGRAEDAAARRAMLEREAPRFRGMACEAELAAELARR